MEAVRKDDQGGAERARRCGVEATREDDWGGMERARVAWCEDGQHGGATREDGRHGWRGVCTTTRHGRGAAVRSWWRSVEW